MRPYTVGLTGGVASGKSAAAAAFAALGVPVIDTDVIARDVVAPGTPALAEIVATFGPQFLDAGGGLDRRRLRTHVFADPAARKRLEAILHPHIGAQTLAALERTVASYCILVVPLLVESGFARHVDRVLVVDCPEALQRERLAGRDGSSTREIEHMLAAQLSRAGRLQHADDVLYNAGSLDELHQQVQKLHAHYLELCRR